MRIRLAVLAVLASIGSISLAAAPPALVNYQGVLRNNADAPLSGTYDMTLRFFSAAAAGDEILIDRHTAAAGSAVTVSGGLFNVTLGAGSVIDGSGPGSYTSLADMFRDYGTVYVSVQVGSETLSPRTQIVAAAYALNASNLSGKPVGSFIDTSAVAQTKSGTLSCDASGVGSGYGMRAFGVDGGLYAADATGSGHSELGKDDFGIRGFGSWPNGSGGYFKDTSNSGESFLAHGNTGIDGYGSFAGGIFRNGTPSSYNEESYLSYANRGIYARGREMGGEFSAIGATGTCRVAWGNAGVEASGSAYGGHFSGSGVGDATLAQGGYGIVASGAAPNGMAGLFRESNGSSEAWLGNGDVGLYSYGANGGGIFRYGSPASYFEEVTLAPYGDGLRAYGRQNGGLFTNSYGTQTSVAYGGAGIQSYGYSIGGDFRTNGRWGIFYAGWNGHGGYGAGTYADGGMGGEFIDRIYTGYARLGWGDNGIQASGSNLGGEFLLGSTGYFSRLPFTVCTTFFCTTYSLYGNGAKAFVQNHPFDNHKVVVYTALEGDEAGTYTRGSGQLVNGVGTIPLGKSFALVTNPDVGLTAHLTPRDEPIALAVSSLSTEALVVRGPAGSNARFDYVVHGLRLGTEYYQAVADKEIDSPLPVSNWVPPTDLPPQALADTPYERFARVAATSDESALRTRQEPNTANLIARIGLGKPRPEKVIRNPVANSVPKFDVPKSDDAVAPTSASVETAERHALERPDSPHPVSEVAPFPPFSTAVVVGESVESGDLLTSDPSHPGQYVKATRAADPAVLGIVAGEPHQSWNGRAPLAMAGQIVKCHVDASTAPIVTGDLMVSSTLAGFASRAAAPVEPGTVIGKALEPLIAGTGTIDVLVMSR